MVVDGILKLFDTAVWSLRDFVRETELVHVSGTKIG